MCPDAVETVDTVLPALHGRGVQTSVLTERTASRSARGVPHTPDVTGFLLLGSFAFVADMFRMVRDLVTWCSCYILTSFEAHREVTKQNAFRKFV